jgi:hypothetical protein
MPRQLRRDLPEFAIRTVQEEGWSSFKNGALLRQASAAGFDVLVSADQRLQYQQNIATFKIGVVVIEAVDTRLPSLRTTLPDPDLRTAISEVKPGSLLIVRTP